MPPNANEVGFPFSLFFGRFPLFFTFLYFLGAKVKILVPDAVFEGAIQQKKAP
jgi:hypothetical protein